MSRYYSGEPPIKKVDDNSSMKQNKIVIII